MLPRKNRGKGKGLAFIEKTLSSVTDECVLWPFWISKEGYPGLGTHAGSVLAHRYICELVYGTPPDGKPQAAHHCGNKACINPRHIRWASQKENEADKRAHGTYYDRVTAAKLTPEKVQSIRFDFSQGILVSELVEKYSTPKPTIEKVVRRETWKHV